MQSKLFVGNLSFDVLENEVQALFSQAGTVTSVNVLQDKTTGKGRGFGFVEMSSDEEAKKAIEMFNGQEFQGRNLTVNIARPKDERGRGSGGGSYAGGEQRRGGGGGYRGGR
jgi:RNA recognition motif-containing protein